MNPKLMRLLSALVLVLLADWAQAAVSYTCSLAAPTSGYTATYAAGSNNPVAISVDVTCVKATGSGTGTPLNLASVAANDGLNFSGAQNRGANGINRINYDLYTDATCTTLWPGSGNLSFTYPAAGGTVSQTTTVTFYACLPSPQSPALLPSAAVFTDTVALTLTAIAPATLSGTNPQSFSVSITVPTICTMTAINPLAFGTYTAFGSAVTANTSAGVQCNKSVAYSLDVGAGSAPVGGVLGTNSLYYTMAINTTNSGGVNPFAVTSAASTGNSVTYFINGTIPAGQAGACATATCAAQSETRTLTVTY